MSTWKALITEELKLQGEGWDDIVSITLTEDELNKEFDDSFGIAEGKPFTAWTARRVYFPVCYDGSGWVDSVSRDPDGQPTAHCGGGQLLADRATTHPPSPPPAMPALIPPPLAASDWTFRVTKIETEEVSLPWSPVEGSPSWQPGRTFAVVQMTAETIDACAIPECDLIGKGFVFHGMQHRILQVLDTIPLKVRTQAWPVVEVAS